MAQAPTTRKLGLTRDQLASFLQDHEQIKQFENLFATVDSEVAPNAVTEATTLAQTAYAMGNEALAGVSALNNLVAPLVTAPPPTGGTVTSVAASGGTTGLTFTGSPITTSGTLVLGGTLAITNGGTGATTAAGARANLEAAKSGANSDITSLSGITGGISTPDYIDFDTAATVTRATGRLWWDNADGIQTLNLGMAGSNATLQIGEEMYFRIKASSAITEGQVVMFTGTVGNSGALTGAPATGLTKDTASYVMGVATENIANNGWGYVTQFGLVRGINTTGGAEAWVDGQILYYNPAVTGGLTKNVPSAPNAKVEVASVVKAGKNGSLFVRPIARFSLTQLNDVETAAAANLDLLQYNGGSGYWQHVSPTTISVGTATNLAGGAANRIAYQTGAGATSFITAPTTANTFLEWSGSAFQWSVNPLGTVTSVNASGGTTGLTFSGAPITTSGTLTLGGTLGVANGGTGATSLTAGYLTKGNGTAAVSASVVYDDGTNVGVGNASPGAKLDVAGNIRLSAANPNIELNSGGPQIYLPGVANTLAFATGGGLSSPIERFRIGSAGQWGIGGANYGTSGQVLTSQGASAAPVWATPTTGTVTSVSGSGTVNGITLTGTVTSSGSLTLGGTLSGVSLTTQVTGTLPVANGGTGVTTSTGTGSNVLSSLPSFGATIGVGGASASASGAGVSFPASQSASTDPNTLDDYEEGTCTITIKDSAGNSATMGGSNVFRYVKIGAFVQVSGTLNWTSIASLSAGSRIQFHGLPFVVNNVGNYRAPAIIGSSAPGSFNITRAEIAGGADNGNTFIYGTKVSGNNVDGSMVPADLGSSGTVYGFQINYTTTF